MSETISEGIADLQLIVPVMISVITQVLDLFMTPPLVFFTAAAFCAVGFKIAAYLLTKVKQAA